MPNRFYRRPNHRREDRAAADRFVRRRRQRIGAHVPRRVFHDLILELLLNAPNHALPSRQIRRTIAERLDRAFTPVDLSMRSGSPLWVNELQWQKKRMVMDGLLETVLSSGHGTWRLTRKGVTQAVPF
jgi:hypothetical protein